MKSHTDKKVLPIPSCGFRPVHMLFNKEEILKMKGIHPDAEVMAHPECSQEVCEVADFVGSTSRMCREVLTSKARKFIVATEIGLLYRLRKDMNNAIFLPAYKDAVCVNMKLHTLEKIYRSLKDERYAITVPPKIMSMAREPIEFMLKTRETKK